MYHNILDNRIKRKNKYQLLETVENISIDPVLLEGGSFVGSQIHRMMTAALMALFDDATGELSGMVAVLPLLYKNVYEIYTTNKAVKKMLASDVAVIDQKQMSELRQKLINDISDIVNAIVLSLPLPIIDTAGIAFFNMLDSLIIGRGSASFLGLIEGFEAANPKLSKILGILAYPFGGNVIYKGLSNIAEINDIIEIDNARQKEIEMQPNEVYSDFFIDDIDVQQKEKDQMAEAKNIVDRWQVLSGIN